MLRLVFDTSTPAVSIGIWHHEDGWLETIDKADLPNQQSKVLLTMIEDLFKPLGIEKKEVNEIAVGIAPGSYTGLRMGITVAKVWAYAQKIPVQSFSSRDLLEKTKKKEPQAEFPQVKYLTPADLHPVKDINSLEPIYENDHFANR